MVTAETTQRFAALDEKMDLADYNFAHFRTKHFVSDLQATMEKRGLSPGAMAPDFVLPVVGGGTLRLRDLRGAPVLLHFGSFT